MPSAFPKFTENFNPWTESDYVVGVESFDAEHRGLARLIEHLHTAALVQRDRLLADQIFTQLIQKTRIHFVHEEDLLREHGYGEVEKHTEQHSQLLKEIQEMQRTYVAGGLSALVLLRFLQSWLIDHIKSTDRRYSPYLKRIGVY